MEKGKWKEVEEDFESLVNEDWEVKRKEQKKNF